MQNEFIPQYLSGYSMAALKYFKSLKIKWLLDFQALERVLATTWYRN